MSFRIEYQLYDATPVPKELLGEIRVSDETAAFCRTDTYVDSWLEAMVEALRQYVREGRGRAEIVEEPESVSISGPASACLVQIGGGLFGPHAASEVGRTLQQAVRSLLGDLVFADSLTPVLDKLRAFATEGNDG